MSKWFPQWTDAQHELITLRQVLSHTSGLWHEEGAHLMESQTDSVEFASKLEVVDPPGTLYAYNNAAVQLLSRVVQLAAGEPPDAYVARHVFGPLGIAEWEWHRAHSGNVFAHAGSP